MLKYAIKDFQEDREFKQVARTKMVNYRGCLKESRLKIPVPRINTKPRDISVFGFIIEK